MFRLRGTSATPFRSADVRLVGIGIEYHEKPGLSSPQTLEHSVDYCEASDRPGHRGCDAQRLYANRRGPARRILPLLGLSRRGSTSGSALSWAPDGQMTASPRSRPPTRNDPSRPFSDEFGDKLNASVDNRGASVRAGRPRENPPIRAGSEGAT